MLADAELSAALFERKNMLADARDNRGAYEVVAVVAREEEERVVRHALPRTTTLASLLQVQRLWRDAATDSAQSSSEAGIDNQ